MLFWIWSNEDYVARVISQYFDRDKIISFYFSPRELTPFGVK